MHFHIEHSDPVVNVPVLPHLKQSRQPSEVRKVLSDICPSCCYPQRDPVKHTVREDLVAPPLIGLVKTGLQQSPEPPINTAVTANREPIFLLNAPPKLLDLSRIGSGQVLEQDPWLQTHDRVHTKHCALGL